MEDKPLAGHTDSVTCMTISGNLLFTGSDDCTIRLWNLQSKYTPAEPLGRHDEGKSLFEFELTHMANFVDLCSNPRPDLPQ